MNKAELVEAIVQETKLTKSACEKFLDSFITSVRGSIKSKGGVRLVGFGTFTTAKRKARTARNPQTGKEVTIPARTVPVFRPGQELKDHVNKGR